MYRFHCTVCQKMKRVQHVPRNIHNPHSVNVSERIGVCDKHSQEDVRIHTTRRYAEAHDIPVVKLNMLRRKVAK